MSILLGLSGCSTRVLDQTHSLDSTREASIVMDEPFPVHYRVRISFRSAKGARDITQDALPTIRTLDFDVPVAFAAIGWTANKRHLVAVIRHGGEGVYYIAIDGETGRLIEDRAVHGDIGRPVDSPPDWIAMEIADLVRQRYPAYFKDRNLDPLQWLRTDAARSAYREYRDTIAEQPAPGR
jgi:hypothetical protein